MSKHLQPDRKCVLASGVLKPVIAANRRKQEQDGEIEYWGLEIICLLLPTVSVREQRIGLVGYTTCDEEVRKSRRI